MCDITTSIELAQHIIDNPYAWPGGYPTYAIMDDGGALCPECVKAEQEQITESTGRDGWTIQALAVNWEDIHLFCDHCNERIESAYGECA